MSLAASGREVGDNHGMKPQDSRIKTVEVLYFARLREAFGCEREGAAVPETVTNVAGLRDWLRQRGEPWAHELAPERPVRVAVNQDMANADTPIGDGDEVAFFPPVTGG